MVPLIEWFRPSPPPQVVPNPSIIVGGTGLLREFLPITASITKSSSRRDRGLGQITRACHDRIIRLSSQGMVLANSLRWHNNDAA